MQSWTYLKALAAKCVHTEERHLEFEWFQPELAVLAHGLRRAWGEAGRADGERGSEEADQRAPFLLFSHVTGLFFFRWLYSHLLVSLRQWFQDPQRYHNLQTLKSLSQPPTPASTGSTNHGSCTTDLWTTWVWTAWVHLHVDFLQLTHVSVNPCNTEKKKSTYMDPHSSNPHCSGVNYCCVFSQRKRIAFKEYSFLGLPWWVSG